MSSYLILRMGEVSSQCTFGNGGATATASHPRQCMLNHRWKEWGQAQVPNGAGSWWHRCVSWSVSHMSCNHHGTPAHHSSLRERLLWVSGCWGLRARLATCSRIRKKKGGGGTHALGPWSCMRDAYSSHTLTLPSKSILASNTPMPRLDIPTEDRDVLSGHSLKFEQK